MALCQLSACSHKKVDGLPGWHVTRTVIRSTAGATLKDPVGASRIGLVVMRNRVGTLVMGNSPVIRKAGAGSKRLPAGTGAGGEAFEALLDREKLPPRTSGSLQFYIDGKTFFPVYLKELQAARKSIDVQTFIFDNDDFAVQVAEVLRARSREVKVRVLFDGLGSDDAATVNAKSMPADFKPPEKIYDYLTSGSNLECRRTGNAYLMADHSKLHIIDGDKAFVGGMNLGREYRHEWHDLMSRAEGPVVQDLAQLYERRWCCDAWWRKMTLNSATPWPTAAPSAKDLPAQPQVPLRLLMTDVRRGRLEILKATLLGIRCAARRVWIETPYFSCDEIMTELEAALKRGVDVRIVVPAEVDQKIMESNNAADLKTLIDQGAKVYAYPGMTHLKATVCDDWAMFGSANYDTLSQRINVEINLAISDRETVNLLATRVFEHDFRSAARVTSAMANAKGGPFAEFVGDQL